MAVGSIKKWTSPRKMGGIPNQIQTEYGDEQAEAVDGTAEPVSRDQILRRERRQRNIHFPYYSADHEQDWQPYPVDLYSTICYDHIYCYGREV